MGSPETQISGRVYTIALPRYGNSQIRRRVNADGGLPAKRAVVLADATADAALVEHVRALEGEGLTIGRPHLYLLELNGFFGQGTHLFAGNTATATGPRQAAIAIDISVPDNRLAFFFKRERRNGTRRARLPAGVT